VRFRAPLHFRQTTTMMLIDLRNKGFLEKKLENALRSL
jgi:hypothetical protein